LRVKTQEDPTIKDACKEMDKKKEALASALLVRVERFLELLQHTTSHQPLSLPAIVPAGKDPLDHLKSLWSVPLFFYTHTHTILR
jgi:hypothetical protein